jgi:cytochrome c biogenesis protein CcmG, thiol:disulfide interchange protein DsbE
MNRWHLLFFVILIGGGSWLWLSRVPLAAQTLTHTPQSAIGYPAPDFTLKTLDGKSFTLSAHRGTPIVLNFWATWCGPCQNEMPAMQATATRYAGRVLVIGVDQAEAGAVVRQFVDQVGVSYPILLDADQSVAHRYNIGGLPTTFFIDNNGVIRYMRLGEMNQITLAEAVAQIIP